MKINTSSVFCWRKAGLGIALLFFVRIACFLRVKERFTLFKEQIATAANVVFYKEQEE